MKNLIYILFFAFLMSACANNKNNTPQKPIDGIYKTTYPCADCGGIEASLTIHKNQTYLYKTLYIDGKGTNHTYKGKYQIKDSILTIEANKTPIHFLIGNNIMTLLDANLKVNKDVFASYYQLKKQKPFHYEGNYATYFTSDDEYKQTLAISKQQANHYKVQFSASSVKNRANCRFTGVGEIKRDTLWVNIANEKDKKVWMYIAPSHDNLGVEVFTAKFNERFKMMFYCGGGSSLAGKYIKNSITAKNVGIIQQSNTIEDVIYTLPPNQISKKVGKGEFKDDVYDDYEICNRNNKHLLTITPKETGKANQKINRIVVNSPFFKTAKGINCKSTYQDIKNAYTINKIEPTREHIVLIVDEINANFSIPKNKLKKGWWNKKTKTVNANKIPLKTQVDSFIIWWNKSL